MEQVRFWLNNEQFKETIKKLGHKSRLYKFAKKAFLKELEDLIASKSVEEAEENNYWWRHHKKQ